MTDTASTPQHKANRDLLDPAAYRSIWILGWPVLINMGTHTLFSVVDLFWVHKLGTDAVAAVALAGNIMFCMFGLTQIIYAGSLAMISRRVGSSQAEMLTEAPIISAQAVHLSLLLGLVIASSGALLTPAIIKLFDVSQALTQNSIDYLVPMMWSFLPLFPSMAFAAIFTAIGNTRIPMYIGVTTNLINAALDPFLIFGWGPFPELGISGAGIASLICQFFGLSITWLAFKLAKFPFDRPKIFKNNGIGSWPTMLRIGIPSGLAALTRPFSTLFLLKVIATFGSEGVAAFGITIRALSPIWLYHAALMTAVGTLTGQALGDGKLNDIKALVANSIKLSLLTSVAVGLIYFVFAEETIGIFEQENQEVIRLGALFLQLLVIATLSSAPVIVWGAVLSGAGETRSPMVIAIYANWLIKLPLAYYFAVPMNWGIEGIWVAMVISIIYENFAIYLAYRKGKWKHTQV